jgi:mannose-binding lectin 1
MFTSLTMRIPLPTLSLLTLFSASLAVAQDIVRDTSFGYGSAISGSSFSIPGWQILGEGHVPQLLSDKVIVTPPYGGNKRGALWAENKNHLPQWAVDFEFRAGGSDRGGGSLQLWYGSDGQSTIGTSSLYSVGRFDGLVLALDAHNGRQSIRGFLNDGSVEYRSHPNVDSLAFGHCDYAYRNLGRPSELSVKSTTGGLEVLIDDTLCFRSDKITLPVDYYFGITAASTNPPDSFEVFKFLLKPSSYTPTGAQPPPPPKIQNQGQMPIPNQDSGSMIREPADLPASHFTTSAAQFEDLHSRLTLLSKSITNLFGEITRHTAAEESRYQEILRQIQLLSPNTQSSLQPSNLDGRLSAIERTLTSLQSELSSGDHKRQFSDLQSTLKEMNIGVTEHLPNRVREYVADHAPRVGFMITCFILFQLALVVAYVLYKRRRANAPKKYL